MKAIRTVSLLLIILLLAGGCAPAKKAENDSQPVGSESESDTSDILFQKTPDFTGDEPIKPYWASKNAGSANELLGDVLFVSIFMEDPETEITPQVTDEVLAELRKTGDWLEAQAQKRGKTLKITTGRDDAELIVRYTYPKVITDSDGLSYDDIMLIMRNLKMGAYYNKITQKYNTQNVAFILHLNKNGRSYASSSSVKTPSELLLSDAYEAEYSYFDVCTVYNMYYSEKTGYDIYAHELLHLFGAVDLYYYEFYEDNRGEDAVDMYMEKHSLMNTYFQKEIMLASPPPNEIGDLTAYLIGWEETVPIKYAYFLYNN